MRLTSTTKIAPLATLATLATLAFVGATSLGCGARGKTAANVTKAADGRVTRHLTVPANQPVTLVGVYKQGDKVDIEPKGGEWSARPGMSNVGPEGASGTLCLGDGSHHCIGGDAMAPLMGVIVLMTACPIEQQGCTVFGRDYLEGPLTFTAPRDGYMYLAPNDWMESIGDNSGSVLVDVTP